MAATEQSSRDLERIDVSEITSCRAYQLTCQTFEKSISNRLGRVLAYWTTVSRYSRYYTLAHLSKSQIALLHISVFYGLMCEDCSDALLSLYMISEWEDESEMSPSDVQFWLGSMFKTENMIEDIRTVVRRLTELKNAGTFEVPVHVLEAFAYLLEKHRQGPFENGDSNHYKLIDEKEPVDPGLLKDILSSEVYTKITSIYSNFFSDKILRSLSFGMETSRFSKIYFLNTLLLDHTLCLSYYHGLSKGDIAVCLLVFALSKSPVIRTQRIFPVRDMAIWLADHFPLAPEDLQSGKIFLEKINSTNILKVPEYFINLSTLLSRRLDAIRSSNKDSRSSRSSLEQARSDDVQPKASTSKKSDSPNGYPKSLPASPNRNLPKVIKENRTDDVSKTRQQVENETSSVGVLKSIENPILEKGNPTRKRRPQSKKSSSSNENEDIDRPKSTSSTPTESETLTKQKQPKASIPTNLDLPKERQKASKLSTPPEVEMRIVASQKTTPPSAEKAASLDAQTTPANLAKLTSSVTIHKVSVGNNKPDPPSQRPEKALISSRLQKMNSKRNNSSNIKSLEPKEKKGVALSRGDKIYKEAVKNFEDEPSFSTTKQSASKTCSNKKARIEERSFDVNSPPSKLDEKNRKKMVSYSDQLTIFTVGEESDRSCSPDADNLAVGGKVHSTTASSPIPSEVVPMASISSSPVPLSASTALPSKEEQPTNPPSQQKIVGKVHSTTGGIPLATVVPQSAPTPPTTAPPVPLSSSSRLSTKEPQPSISPTQPKVRPKSHHMRSVFIPKHHRFPVVSLEKITLSTVEHFQVSTKHQGNKLKVQASENSKVTTKTATSTSPDKKSKSAGPSSNAEPQEASRIPTSTESTTVKNSLTREKSFSKAGPKSSKKDRGKNIVSSSDAVKKVVKNGEESLGLPRNADEAEKMLALLMEDSSDSQHSKISRPAPSPVQSSSPSTSIVTSTTSQPKPSTSKNKSSEATPKSNIKASSQTPDSPRKRLSSTPVVNLTPKKHKNTTKESPMKPKKASIEKICEALSASLTGTKESSDCKKSPSESLEDKVLKHKSKRNSSSSSRREREKSKDPRKSSSASRKSSRKEEKRRSASSEVLSTTVECFEKSVTSISISNKVDISSLRNSTPNEKVPPKHKRKHCDSPSTSHVPCESSMKRVEPILPLSSHLQQSQKNSTQNSSEASSNPPATEVLGPKVMVEPVNGALQPVSLESEVPESSYGNADEIDDNMDLENVTAGSEVIIYESVPDQSTLQEVTDGGGTSSNVIQQVPDSSTKENVKTQEVESSTSPQQSKFEVITVPHDSVTSCTSSFVVSNISLDDSPGQAYYSVGQPETWPPGYKAVVTLQDSNEIPQDGQTIVIMDGPGVECPVTFSADTANEVLQQIKEATVVPANVDNPEDDVQDANYLIVENTEDKSQLLKNCLLAQKRKHLFLKEYKPGDGTYEISAEILGIGHGTQVEYIEEVQETEVQEVEISIPSERLSEVNDPSYIQGILSGNGKRRLTDPTLHAAISSKRPRPSNANQSHNGTSRSRTTTQKRGRQKKEGAIARTRSIDAQLLNSVMIGDLTGIESCLARGGDINSQSNDWRKLLHHAAIKGHFHVVSLLLDKGVEVDPRDSWDSTPLMLAARNGHVRVARLLLERGAELEAKGLWGSTALHFAIMSRKVEMVKFLLEAGANVNARDEDYWTPMGCANQGTDPELLSIKEILRAYNGIL